MLTFFKTRRSLPAPSPAPRESPAPHAGLKPLRLVEKLVAAHIIDRLPEEKPSPMFQLLKTRKLENKGTSSARKPSRSSLASQRAVTQERAPFVVPLRFNPTAPGVIERRTRVSRAATRRPVRTVKEDTVPKPSTAFDSRIPKPSPGSCRRLGPVALMSPRKSSRIPVRVGRPSHVSSPSRSTGPPRTSRSPAGRSRIPVFVGRASSGSFNAPCPRASRTPQATPSLIPRFKYMTFPSASSSAASVINIGLETPCPSHTLAVGARREFARKVSALKAVEVGTVNSGKNVEVTMGVNVEVVGKTVKAKDADKNTDAIAPRRDILDSADKSQAQHAEVAARTQHALPIEPEQTQKEDTIDARPLSPDAAKSTPDGKESIAPRTVMGTLLGHLKNRLSWPNTSVISPPTPAPSPAQAPLVMVREPGRRRPAQENVEGPSELQQAFARRAAALAKLTNNVVEPSPTKESRRPLAPLPGFANIFNGRRGPAPTTSMSPCALVGPVLAQESPIARSPSPSDNDDLDQPDTDLVVTELVTTAFGTRRVRRMLVPPITEGALPSRNPQIVMELDRLRAQQKVGSAVSKT
ncbi:hypothetical protein DFH06DRAFT_1168275 [Mycena polygramma]|nr:hypothetical protein DFH06DRAFT_1168275 [Mycena polygramma]